MKKTFFNHLAIIGCCAALFTLASATHIFGQGRGSTTNNPVITIQPLLSVSNWTPVPTTGTMLARKSNAVSMAINSSGLVPGTVVTAWFGIFNNPQFCATTPCTPADEANPLVQASVINAGGKIIGADGVADFGGYRAVGDTIGVFSGPGLLNPMTAQIDLVVRSHGPALIFHPDLLAQQLSIYNGGCPPNPCQSLQVSTHLP